MSVGVFGFRSRFFDFFEFYICYLYIRDYDMICRVIGRMLEIMLGGLVYRF